MVKDFKQTVNSEGENSLEPFKSCAVILHQNCSKPLKAGVNLNLSEILVSLKRG